MKGNIISGNIKKSSVFILLIIFLLGIMLSGCTKDEVVGNYEGIIPCADCEGIKAELYVESDKTYTFSFTYLDMDSEPYIATGSWEIDKEGRLVLLRSDGTIEQYLKIVSQDEVLMLDGDGNEITGTDLNFSLSRTSANYSIINNNYQLIDIILKIFGAFFILAGFTLTLWQLRSYIRNQRATFLHLLDERLINDKNAYALQRELIEYYKKQEPKKPILNEDKGKYEEIILKDLLNHLEMVCLYYKYGAIDYKLLKEDFGYFITTLFYNYYVRKYVEKEVQNKEYIGSWGNLYLIGKKLLKKQKIF